MNKPQIENSDRGITINKTLAWSMVTGLVLSGMWVGTEVSASKKTQEQTLAMIQEMKQDMAHQRSQNELSRNEHRESVSRLRQEMDARVRQLETGRAGDVAELTTFRRDLTELRGDMRELTALLRQSLETTPRLGD